MANVYSPTRAHANLYLSYVAWFRKSAAFFQITSDGNVRFLCELVALNDHPLSHLKQALVCKQHMYPLPLQEVATKNHGSLRIGNNLGHNTLAQVSQNATMVNFTRDAAVAVSVTWNLSNAVVRICFIATSKLKKMFSSLPSRGCIATSMSFAGDTTKLDSVACLQSPSWQGAFQ